MLEHLDRNANSLIEVTERFHDEKSCIECLVGG